MKRLFKIISFPLGAACGIGLIFFLIDFLNKYFEITLSEIITDTGVGVIFGIAAIIPGVIFYIFSDNFAGFISKGISRTEKKISKMPTKDLILCLFGLVLGLVIAFLLSQAFKISSSLIATIINLLLYLTFGILGIRVALARRDEVKIDLMGNGDGDAVYIPDSSVLIDGRIADVIQTGFLSGTFIISQAVVNELKRLTESEDVLKRARGRRGMDMLAHLQESGINIQFDSTEYDGDIDNRLLKLAKARKAAIITNDYNLNKLAHAGGVKILNLNDLSNAVKPILLPGEELSLQIVREGKEPSQGVAYFDDGTMIVVEGGKPFVGQNIECIVTSVLQTSAGRMIFAKVNQGGCQDENSHNFN